MATWTQSVDLRWRPEPTFFDARSDILREVGEKNLLDAFSWRESEIHLRLAPFEVIRVASDGLTASITSPRATIDSSRTVIDLVLELVKPQNAVVELIRTACLCELDRDFTSAQVRLSELLASPWLPGTDPTDTALLVDGYSKPLESPFKVEFGVVGSHEVAPRLMRLPGRIEGQQVDFSNPLAALANMKSPVPLNFDLEGMPDSAVFLDWNWPVRRPIKDSSEIPEIWQATVAEAHRLGEHVKSRLVMGIGEGREELG